MRIMLNFNNRKRKQRIGNLAAMIAEIMKYLVISGFIIGFSFLIRNFMVNHFPMRLHRGFSSAKAVDVLESSEEFEVPVDKQSSPDREQWLRKAIKSP